MEHNSYLQKDSEKTSANLQKNHRSKINYSGISIKRTPFVPKKSVRLMEMSAL